MSSGKFETYLFSYTHDGARWAFDIQAKSPEDARARLAKIANASYDGKLALSIPVPESFVKRLIRWWSR